MIPKNATAIFHIKFLGLSIVICRANFLRLSFARLIYKNCHLLGWILNKGLNKKFSMSPTPECLQVSITSSPATGSRSPWWTPTVRWRTTFCPEGPVRHRQPPSPDSDLTRLLVAPCWSDSCQSRANYQWCGYISFDKDPDPVFKQISYGSQMIPIRSYILNVMSKIFSGQHIFSSLQIL